MFALLLLMIPAVVFSLDFVRVNNPVLGPVKESSFHCPIQEKDVPWEGDHVFNPAAVVKSGSVYLFYRAEDDYGVGVGNHTSRIGLAVSLDGINFHRHGPVLYPDHDEQKEHEWPGGVEGNSSLSLLFIRCRSFISGPSFVRNSLVVVCF